MQQVIISILLKVKLLFLFLVAFNFCFAQNLVINPSFEDTLGCPNQINQVNLANGWSTWAMTPDYYNACANSITPAFGVPLNNRGFQNAHTGDAYIGLFTFTVFVQDQREFVGGQLTSPLVVGQLYFVSFWVNHADTSVVRITTDKLGIRFTTSAFSLVNPDTANNSPHVFSNTIISDTANWVLVQGSFTADSAYTHFGIGNYFQDSLTNQSQIGSFQGNYAYYLIDDVCVSLTSQECATLISVNESGLEEIIKIYPNPFNNMLNLMNPHSFFNASLKLINTMGVTVMEKTNLSGNSVQLEIPELANGIYFLELSEAKSVYRRKLIKH